MLGIIACRALEDELAHVLSEDYELRHLILINNLDCSDLSRKLRSKNRSHLIASWEDIPEMLKGIRSTGRGILNPLHGAVEMLYRILKCLKAAIVLCFS